MGRPQPIYLDNNAVKIVDKLKSDRINVSSLVSVLLIEWWNTRAIKDGINKEGIQSDIEKLAEKDKLDKEFDSIFKGENGR